MRHRMRVFDSEQEVRPAGGSLGAGRTLSWRGCGSCARQLLRAEGCGSQGSRSRLSCSDYSLRLSSSTNKVGYSHAHLGAGRHLPGPFSARLHTRSSHPARAHSPTNRPATPTPTSATRTTLSLPSLRPVLMRTRVHPLLAPPSPPHHHQVGYFHAYQDSVDYVFGGWPHASLSALHAACLDRVLGGCCVR